MSDREDVSGADQTRGVLRKPVGFEVVVDRMSMPYLAGATIDFVDGLQGRGFLIDNPNARGSCSCGDSFH
jgi:Uncharacterized conserved protein